MDLSPPSQQLAPPDQNTSLDSKETSAAPGDQSTYADVQRARCSDEWNATEQTYSCWDAFSSEDRTGQLCTCRTGAWFVRNKETGVVRVQSNACRLRWCPMCSKQRSMHITQVVTTWLKSVKAPKILTLTLNTTANTNYK